MKYLAGLFCAAVILTSCASTSVYRESTRSTHVPAPENTHTRSERRYSPEAEPEQTAHSPRREIVEYARGLVGEKNINRAHGLFRNDCSGFVLGVYRSMGYQVVLRPGRYTRSVSRALYRTLHARGYTYTGAQPAQADVVFFRGTVDGSPNSVTHVGLVAGILSDHTVLIINYTSTGVTELRMNLRYPHLHKKNGMVINDFLKKSRPGPPHQEVLSGELFYCYGDLLGYVGTDME
ncbi:MAG: hypothetical protein ACOC7U_01325 [Spirochaetota bacterium]